MGRTRRSRRWRTGCLSGVTCRTELVNLEQCDGFRDFVGASIVILFPQIRMCVGDLPFPPRSSVVGYKSGGKAFEEVDCVAPVLSSMFEPCSPNREEDCKTCAAQSKMNVEFRAQRQCQTQIGDGLVWTQGQYARRPVAARGYWYRTVGLDDGN